MHAAAPALGVAAERAALAQVRSSIAVHGKSFALASLWLAPTLRDEVAALYAFCRRADDAIDLAPVAEHRPTLARLRAELADLYSGARQTDPVLQAFQRVVLARGIPMRYASELIDGLQMDVEGHSYQDLPDLLRYCYRVAGVVGLMMCHLTGVRSQAALRHAVHLGVAMQLTNICRDVREDWGRGRLYLPTRWLAAQGAPQLEQRLGQPWPQHASAAAAHVVAALLTHADRYYRSGAAGISQLPPRVALAVRTARHVYAAIGGVLRRRGCDVRAARARVSRLRKLGLLVFSLLGALAELPARVRRRSVRARLSVVRYEDVLPI